ncbi:MAG: putative transposase [Candidatus Promineifilaceae bacterium]|jgi:putative transposase
MARSLRLNIPNGWYHEYHRGIERCRIFADDRDRSHFVSLLAEMHDRYRILIHAYVLMPNHYHTVLQTPDANLSEAMQWLHTSYAAWFNTRHRRVGPLWQGRYGAKPVENSAWAYEVSLYVHLNPVCTNVFGLSKGRRRAEGLGLRSATKETLILRLRELRSYAWSSYRAYGGYTREPRWLTTKAILPRAHLSVSEQRKSYREDAKNLLCKGARETSYESLIDRVAVGSQRFREQMIVLAKGGQRETVCKRELRRRISVDDALGAVEAATGVSREVFIDRHGDRGKAVAMFLLRRYGGMTLREVGDAFGGVDYAAVSDRVRRLEREVATDRATRDLVREATENLNLETRPQ